ncbi:uncharacterized protein Z520_12091 [Fonsecaea multimorphosa CBS 102226]|uniref:Vacuolar ATPase assembly protein VMA22 n=1 Tax=Fonsecaea multimorphosa CBS 102226 TaxID=1442371 RepID=A0A0D2GRS1_9EURO|nr:uncharacterized protein Z520_12091 [Fonsecaea multimorphosa CBS 102226]KIX92210.1 hypothetical protein Z520_12091 [Fonsecaea multimorphosa CBS 102226]OAL17586.1 hypothetical protein AYO22_11504 [Fonsecaea multimorphosa]
MPSHLPSPPSSRSTSPDGSSSSQPQLVQAEQVEPQHQSKDEESSGANLLSDRLDALLVSYLTILDTYTNLRAQLSRDLSGGFFALAQANRNANSTLGVGRRYGEEGFDERMKAAKVVKIQETGNTRLPESYNEKEQEEVEEHAPVQKNGCETGNGKSGDERTAAQGNKEDMEKPTGDSEEYIQQSATAPYCFSVSSLASNLTKDPLKWYGILIPTALRTCQSHFATTISSTIPEILNTTSAMRGLEEEIWAVRRQLGIVDNYETANIDELEKKDGDNIESNTTVSRTAGDRDSESLLSNPTIPSPKSQIPQAKKSSSLLSTSPPMANLRTGSRVLKLD